MKTLEEIKKGLIDPDLFCDHCEYYGEPNGCNRPNGSCKAYVNADDAYDLIQQLEAQLPRWISVEERLPEHDVRVLFGYARYGYVGVGHLDREEMDWLDSNEIQVAQPSHWMPLPEPPKEDGGETQ